MRRSPLLGPDAIRSKTGTNTRSASSALSAAFIVSRVDRRSVTDERVETARHRIERCHDGHADEAIASCFGVDHRHDGDALFERADRRNLSQVGHADQRDAIPAACMGRFEHR